LVGGEFNFPLKLEEEEMSWFKKSDSERKAAVEKDFDGIVAAIRQMHSEHPGIEVSPETIYSTFGEIDFEGMDFAAVSDCLDDLVAKLG
jgi:hypothetical protein